MRGTTVAIVHPPQPMWEVRAGDDGPVARAIVLLRFSLQEVHPVVGEILHQQYAAEYPPGRTNSWLSHYFMDFESAYPSGKAGIPKAWKEQSNILGYAIGYYDPDEFADIYAQYRAWRTAADDKKEKARLKAREVYLRRKAAAS